MPAAEPTAPACTRTRRHWWLMLAAVMAFYAWATTVHRWILCFHWTDTWGHLAFIRRTMERGWFPGDAYYEGMPTPPYYSLEHVVFATISRLSGLAPHDVWVTLPPFLSVATIAAVFVWLRALTGDARVAVVGAAVELLIQAPDPAWSVMPYPRVCALAPSALALYSYHRGRERGQLGWFIAAGGALGLSLSIHLFTGGFCLLSLLLLELAHARKPCHLSPGCGLSTGIGLVLASPWILNVFHRWREREMLAPELFTVGDDVWTLPLGRLSLHLYRPSAILDALPWPLWLLVGLGLFVSIVRWHSGRGSTADRYALGATAATLLLLLTPLYGFVVLGAGVWAPRLVQVIPLALLSGTGVIGVADWIRTRTGTARLLLAAALALDIAVTVETGRIVVARLEQYARALTLITPNPLGNWQLADEVAATGPMPRVVLADPWTSYFLPYYLGCSVMVMPPAHGSAYVDHRAREQVARRIFGRHLPMTELRAILDQHHIDMIAIAPGQDWPLPGAADALTRRLRGNRLLQDTGCCERVRLFRYLGPRPDAESAESSNGR